MTRNCLFLLFILIILSCRQKKIETVDPKPDPVGTNLPPGEFKVTSTTLADSVSVLLTWTPSVDPEGSKVNYNVVLDTLSIYTDFTEFTLSKLDSGLNVTGKIISRDSAGLTSEAVFAIRTAEDKGPVVILEDENFEKYLIEAKLDSDQKVNRKIKRRDARKIRELKAGGKGIASLKGIEEFTNLQKLYCFSNVLEKLDVSKNKNLTLLYCYDNDLDSLNIGQNQKLVSLFCYFNSLKKLDTSKNPGLKYLDCDGNRLMTLDVTQNPKLTLLNFSANQISKTDIRKNVDLEIMNGHSNKLTELDLSKNVKLKEFNCGGNVIVSLDVSSNIGLTQLNCSGNALTKLNLKKNFSLIKLNCTFNKITEICVADIQRANGYTNWLKDAGASYALCSDSQ